MNSIIWSVSQDEATTWNVYHGRLYGLQAYRELIENGSRLYGDSLDTRACPALGREATSKGHPDHVIRQWLEATAKALDGPGSGWRSSVLLIRWTPMSTSKTSPEDLGLLPWRILGSVLIDALLKPQYIENLQTQIEFLSKAGTDDCPDAPIASAKQPRGLWGPADLSIDYLQIESQSSH